ncbi:MAG: FAD-dependent oxidoreductase [Ruminococcaceae bacterium]|nr:FAD-dependent oxidoreductase [Oscillospiraceae bacterium]
MEIQTVTKREHDILVIGGGIGGVSAAVAAARSGVSVLLIEKSINLGGLATRGLISWYEPLCDGEGHQMVGGIGEELIRLSASVGLEDLPARWGGKGKYPTDRHRYATHYSPTFFSVALDRWVMAAGVELVLDSHATYPVMEGKNCRGVLVEDAGGRSFYPAKMIIDATGDAAIAYRAGVECVLGDNFLSYWVHDFTYDSAKKYANDKNLAAFRRWNCAGSAANGTGHPAGMKCFHGDSAEEITEFILRGKEMMWKKYEGIETDQREIMTLPEMPQFRTIRHIVGKSTFLGTEDGVDCPDSVGAIGDFRVAGTHYTIPYSTLYHPDYPNILTAGRIISATGDGWEITRVIPGCALTGEAAGVAAALALSHENRAEAVPYEDLRATLERRGVLFDIHGTAR